MPAGHRIEHLKVIRGKRPALQDFSVDIARGTITGLLGPSGCGKTTLIRSIVGTQIVASGTVTVLGQPAGSAGLRRRVGYVPQDPTIYNDLRIVDNVRYFGIALRLRRPGRGRRDRAGRADRSPQPLSAGTCPAVSAPGCRWHARWSPTRPARARRTHRGPGPSAAGRSVGAVQRSRPPAGPRCWSPAT